MTILMISSVLVFLFAEKVSYTRANEWLNSLPPENQTSYLRYLFFDDGNPELVQNNPYFQKGASDGLACIACSSQNDSTCADPISFTPNTKVCLGQKNQCYTKWEYDITSQELKVVERNCLVPGDLIVMSTCFEDNCNIDIEKVETYHTNYTAFMEHIEEANKRMAEKRPTSCVECNAAEIICCARKHDNLDSELLNKSKPCSDGQICSMQYHMSRKSCARHCTAEPRDSFFKFCNENNCNANTLIDEDQLPSKNNFFFKVDAKTGLLAEKKEDVQVLLRKSGALHDQSSSVIYLSRFPILAMFLILCYLIC